MSSNPRIDTDLRALIPPPSAEELAQLEANLIADGCRDPLVVWQEKGILLDGHNRFEICNRLGLPFTVTGLSLPSREAAADWIDANQLGRRNLTPDAMSLLRGRRYERAKRSREANLVQNAPKGNSCPSADTAESLAAQHGVSPRTIKADAQLARAVETLKPHVPDIEQRVMTGDIPSRQAIIEAAKVPESAPLVFSQPAEPSRSTFNRTNENIDWAKWSWNPVTGCEYGCEYCYARDIANRFPPNHFRPTFHEDRLAAPGNTKPSNEPRGNFVFVCSMADLFGPWVPNEWIFKILREVEAHPEWTFLFLTKNPRRLASITWPENAWVGATVDRQDRVAETEDAMAEVDATVRFLSCEPMLEEIRFSSLETFDWVIIGARSKTSTGPEFQPEWEWVRYLTDCAHAFGCAVYWKPNLNGPRQWPEVR